MEQRSPREIAEEIAKHVYSVPLDELTGLTRDFEWVGSIELAIQAERDAKDSTIEGLRTRLKDPMCSRCRDPKAPPISPETLCYSCLKKQVADLTAENLALRGALELVPHIVDCLQFKDGKECGACKDKIKVVEDALTSPSQAVEELKGRLVAGKRCAEVLNSLVVPSNTDFSERLDDAREAVSKAKERGIL